MLRTHVGEGPDLSLGMGVEYHGSFLRRGQAEVGKGPEVTTTAQAREKVISQRAENEEQVVKHETAAGWSRKVEP